MARMGKLERREAETERALKKEKDAKDLMYTEYLDLQSSFVHFKDAQKAMEDPIVLRMALDQARLRDFRSAYFRP